MSDSNSPHGPIVKTFKADALIDMPIDLLREIVHERFKPDVPGSEAVVKILRWTANFLMHGAIDANGVHRTASELTKTQATSRAVELIELAEYLDGFGPTRPKGDA